MTDKLPVSTAVPETKMDNNSITSGSNGGLDNSLSLVPGVAKIPKQKRPKIDRKLITEDEKKKEIERQNIKRRALRAAEIEQSKKDVVKRNRMREDRMAIIRELCAILKWDINTNPSKYLKEQLEAKAELPEPDENLDDLNASDFDSSASESENDEPDPDETDDEVDDEEREHFRVIPWNKKKYQDSEDQKIVVILESEVQPSKCDIDLCAQQSPAQSYANCTSNPPSLITNNTQIKSTDTKDNVSVNQLNLTISNGVSDNYVKIPGLDASLSVLLRELIDDTIKHHTGGREIIVKIPHKYSNVYINIIRLYCAMYKGVRPIYKVERPMKSDPDILNSCIPIELLYNDAKIIGLPVGRQSIEDSNIEAKFDIIFYEIMKQAGIDLWVLLDVANYYNVIGLKELLCAHAAMPIKVIDDGGEIGRLPTILATLIDKLQELGGLEKSKYDALKKIKMAEIEKDIADYIREQNETTDAEKVNKSSTAESNDKKDTSAENNDEEDTSAKNNDDEEDSSEDTA